MDVSTIRPDVLVVGFGNTLRGDDGFGVRVVETLHQRWPALESRTIWRQLLTVELAWDAAQCQQLVLVDAAHGTPAGQLDCVLLPDPGGASQADGEQQQPRNGVPSHALQPEELLEWTQFLYGRSPQTYLVTCTAASFELGEVLSPAVQACVALAAETVRGLMAQPVL